MYITLKEWLQHQHTDSFMINLPMHDFSRQGIHPGFGNPDVTQWTEFFLLHEAHYLYSIFQLSRHPLNK